MPFQRLLFNIYIVVLCFTAWFYAIARIICSICRMEGHFINDYLAVSAEGRTFAAVLEKEQMGDSENPEQSRKGIK